MGTSTAASRIRLAASAVVLALALAACTSADTDAEGSSTDGSTAGSEEDPASLVFAEPEPGAYPVTIEHGLGETEITEQPSRVLVIGWSGPDLAVALGTVPVAQGVAAGIDGDHYPWFIDAVEELGAPLPAVEQSLERGEVDLEYVLAQQPDLILAIHSGITEAEYERLSEIAPTVAHVRPWATSREDHLRLMGAALGRPAHALQIQADLEAELAAAAAENPELEGLTYLQASPPGDDGSLVVFSAVDERSQTLQALGLEPLPEEAELLEAAGNASSFVIGPEEVRALRPDLFVTVADDETWSAALEEHPTFASWEPVAQGRTAVIGDIELGMAFSTATPLGLQWGLDQLLEVLHEGVIEQ